MRGPSTDGASVAASAVPTALPDEAPVAVRALIASFDWSTTPLGPRDAWPEQLRAIVDVMVGSRFPMWMGWGPEMTFLYNDAYAAMTLGRKHPWAMGRRADEVWAEIWGEIGPRIERVMHTGVATWDEALMLFLERAGYEEETYHTFSYSPIVDAAGVPAGMLCVVSEETERVITDRRLATLRAVAEGIAAVATEADVLAVVEDQLGRNQRDLPFAALYLLDDGDPSTARLAAVTGVERGSRLAPEVAHAGAPDGPTSAVAFADAERIVEDLGVSADDLPHGAWDRPATTAVVTPVRASGTDDVIGAFVAGINPYRELDEAYLGFVRVVSGQVEAGLGNARAYDAERRRAEALAELDRSKTQFFSNVSHEFRTPLTLMLGPLEDALASPDGGLDHDATALVHRNALRLLKLVNTLLDFSRIEAGRTRARFEPTDLAAVTRDLASTFESAFQRAGLVLEVDAPTLDRPVHVDRDMWEQIVLNLLSNALKHTFEGRVIVRLRGDGGAAVLTVEDTGIGIAPEHLGSVFQRFHRVPDARSRTFEGSGIGLSLVRTLVELHGGEVSVESMVGSGTTFRVTIPVGSEHLPADRLAARSERATSGLVEAFTYEAARWFGDATTEGDPTVMTVGRDDDARRDLALDDDAPARGPAGRVLIVDDNADMRDYVARLLRDQVDIETAADGRAALRALAGDRPPDLILSDVMMPEMDGFALLRAIRADPAWRLTPVILLSARAGEESRIDGLEAGADDYLVKPFTAAELVARVMTHLRLARQRREALELRDAFVGLVSHELRTPITTIYAAGRLFEKETVTDETRTQLMADVVEESDRLRNLVEDLLTIARTDRGQLSLQAEPVLLRRLAERVIANEGRRHGGHRISIDEPETVPTASADSVYVEHVIRNLVSNAAKYSPAGSDIRIVLDGDDREVRLRVQDEGPGVPEGDEDRLFNLYYRSPTTALEVPGAGIGLYVCRRIVEAMGGRVWMTRRPEGGSEFGFALPTAPEEAVSAD